MDNRLSEDISNWIKDKVEQSGQRGVVFGLSGGVDSAVVAALCKKALGENSLGVIMPCRSGRGDVEHASLVVEKFGLKVEIVDLSNAYDALISLFPKGNRLASANIKPRLRMVTLYYFANLHNYLVVGAGNKSEVSVGYFTKYGDGGADIMPIADLLKKEVIALAKELGVPDGIINKPPSAGLWEGQTDEDEMGITYEQLDSFLEGNFDKQTNEKIAKKIEQMISFSEHKRCSPSIFRKERV